MKPTCVRRQMRLCRSCYLVLLALVLQFTASADQIIYSDSLQNGWQNYSWATVNFANGSPVHSGTASISVTEGAYTAVYVHANGAFDPSGFTNLTFWINGGASGGQLLHLQATFNGSGLNPGIQLAALSPNTWQQINAPMSSLVPAGQTQIDGFWLQDRTGASQPVFYVDDMTLQSGPPAPPVPLIVQVDAQANRHAISPMIYGSAFASASDLATLNFTMNRSGGNAETRYNWLINAHNRGADFYFESIGDNPATPGASDDDFISQSKAGGAQPMITVPMIGWMPKLGPSRGKLASYSTNKYGPQTGHDAAYMPDAGNGIGTNYAAKTSWLITSNNPADADFPTNSAFQSGLVQHLISQWGNSTNGGVRYYFMDNEHSIWFSTHRDVHPVGPSMQEIRDKILDYASMVKSNDPNATVLGPEEWGWGGYFFSGYDQQNAGNLDRATNGGWEYMPWLLNQIHLHDTTNGQRLLDYFTLHCYPQGGEGGNDVSSGTELLRNKSTRQFWDTSYVDQSWIGSQAQNNIIMLIPRMRNWVNTYYPGTKIGVTEYNWGAEPYMSGATAQADILGIFGREGLDLATRWTTPDASTPTFLAMKIYRNYDGNKSTFGDTSVSAKVPNPDNLSAFAAIRTNDSTLTVMVVNKVLSGSSACQLSVTNFASSGTAQAWQLTSANVISRLADVPYTGGILSNTLPAQSVTLFILSSVKNLSLRVGSNASPGQLELWMDGYGGQNYFLQASTNLINWTTISTNTFVSNSFRLLLGTTNVSNLFYRGVLNGP